MNTVQSSSKPFEPSVSRDQVAERVLRLFRTHGTDDASPVIRGDPVGRLLDEHWRRGREVAIPGSWDDARGFPGIGFPEHGESLEAFLEYLETDVVPYAVNTASPRFIGHMTSALPEYVSQLARMVAALNQNVVKVETSRVFTAMERQVLGSLHRTVFGAPESYYEKVVQDPERTLGMLTSGGTLANLSALWCARNVALGPAVERQGLSAALHRCGYDRAVILGSSLMHYSIDKAADILGIGTANVLRIPCRTCTRVDVDLLARTARECRANGSLVLAVVGVAGATDSGSIDELNELADVASELESWLHVDAAWAGPLLFSREHRTRLRGVERAHSVTIDAHKQLYLPLGVGIVLLRDDLAAAAIEKNANYIVRRGSRDLGKRSAEGSRPANALFVAAALRILGHDGLEFLVDEGVRKTRWAADRVRARPEFRLVEEPQTNIMLYRCLPRRYRGAHASALGLEDERTVNEFNMALQCRQRDEGRTFVSRTMLTQFNGAADMVALRMVLANPLTSEADIDAVLDDQLRIATDMEA